MNLKKWVVILVITLAILAVASLWMFRSEMVSAAVSEKDLITVKRVDYPLLVSATGILEARSSVSIGPPQIKNEYRFKLARMVEEGTAVSEGDFLLEFDPADISRRLRDETANFQRVQEEYQKKRSDFDIQLREQKLTLDQARADYEKLDNKLSQQAELESAIVVEETRIQRDTAKKRVELLEEKLKHLTQSGDLDLQISRSNENHYRSRMDDLQEAIDSLVVRAPVSGVVIYRREWNNEPRQVGDNIFVLDTVLEIPDLSSMRAKISVDEVDAGKVKVGQDAFIVVDALQGRSFAGKVRSISAILKQASYDRPQKVSETIVELTDEDLSMLRPGMSVKAQIKVGEYTHVVVIPLSSIQERNGSSFVQVWRPDQKAWDWRMIQLRTNDGVAAVVESGLEANEQIRVKPKV